MGDNSSGRGKRGAQSPYFVTPVKSGDKKMKEERKLYRKMDKDMTISSTFWKGKKSVIGRYERLQKLDQHAISAPRHLHQRMEDLVKHLISIAKNQMEKHRVLFRWIAENIDYDVAGLRAGRGVSTAEEALRKRVAVCGGYVDLLKRFCEKAGLQCDSVSGYDKGANYYVGQEELDSCSHAWSIIYVNGKPFYCDPTWASGSVDKSKNKFTREWREHWFMSDPSLFENTHLPGPSNEGGSVNNKKNPPPEKWNKTPKLGVMMGITQASLSLKEGVLQAKDNEIDVAIKLKVLVSIQHFLYSKASGFTQEIEYQVMHFWKKDTVILRVKLPGKGTYKLDIYATKTLKAEGKGQQSTTQLHDKLVTYTVIGKSNTRHPKFYKRRYGCLPPDVLKGYACVSHKESVIETSKNRLVLEMSCPKTGDMIAKLTNQSQPNNALKNRIYQERLEDKHAFHIHFHTPGLYNFAVHNEPSQAGKYTEFAIFMINFTGKPHLQQPVFPDGIKWKPLLKSDHGLTCLSHKDTTIRLRNGAGTVKLSRSTKNNKRLKFEVRDIYSNKIRESETSLFVESVDGKRNCENFNISCRMSREGFYVLHLFVGTALAMRWLIVCDKGYKGELYPANNENWGPVREDFNKLEISFPYHAMISVPNGKTLLKINIGSQKDLTIFGKLLAVNGTTSYKQAVTVQKAPTATSKFITMEIVFPDNVQSGIMELYGGKNNEASFPCIGKWLLVRK
ncbi:Kyphoscoliosis peptidase [Holothuria leucospilota]|uniref:Kyphoscoliosis peptidase n=1 Tax=Holothuria leucospilota TaxID=206669 RepID=A0A9Q1H332_HOLLE|nr:Kyphoscoliosis peptidase [Holothuria leucospilota]